MAATSTSSGTVPRCGKSKRRLRAKKELAELRNSSRLLRLGSGAEVIKRVDFRNTGPDQVPGLIVMTVDDGASVGADLDPTIDGLVAPQHDAAGNLTDARIAGLVGDGGPGNGDSHSNNDDGEQAHHRWMVPPGGPRVRGW